MIELAAQLKSRHGLKVFVVSNEARELNLYRIRKRSIFSSFVHVRKPDVEIFRLVLDISQAEAKRVLYIENTPMFIEIAKELGIKGILHTDYKSTRAKLASFGLEP